MPHATERQRYSVVSDDSRWSQGAMLISDGKYKICRATGCDKGVARWPIDGEYWWSPYWCNDRKYAQFRQWKWTIANIL